MSAIAIAALCFCAAAVGLAAYSLLSSDDDDQTAPAVLLSR